MTTHSKHLPATDVRAYSSLAIPHLEDLIARNAAVMDKLASQLAEDIPAGKSLLVFGSGHSGLFPLELYHRAGGASFVVPVVAEFLLPTAGPPVVRVLERTPAAALAVLNRSNPKPEEMIWISSQSGINGAVVELALEARKKGLRTVAFTSVAHSRGVKSRHPSGKRLFEVCDETVDFGGVVGDAVVQVGEQVMAGPLSTLSAVMLGHSILVAACARLEAKGVRCIYTSVNTAEGDARNRSLEEVAKVRDPLLR